MSFFDYRGTNAIDIAIGTSIMNGDLPDPEFESYFKIGYKRHITNYLNINLTYNKYNLAFKDVYNEGFMSFDLNLELLFSPYKAFSPFISAGYGYNAANYFETTSDKVQAAAGFEFIVVDGVGLKLFGEYNYSFSDELERGQTQHLPSSASLPSRRRGRMQRGERLWTRRFATWTT